LKKQVESLTNKNKQLKESIKPDSTMAMNIKLLEEKAQVKNDLRTANDVVSGLKNTNSRLKNQNLNLQTKLN
jgi:hypothetical protein